MHRFRNTVLTAAALATGAIALDHPAETSALREEINRALARLDADQREAFLLKHVEELEYEQMAVVTGAGVSALKMRVQRAFVRLRALLQEVPNV